MAPNHSETGVVSVMSPGKSWKESSASPGLSPVSGGTPGQQWPERDALGGGYFYGLRENP